jgi:hypothetical protein
MMFRAAKKMSGLQLIQLRTSSLTVWLAPK